MVELQYSPKHNALVYTGLDFNTKLKLAELCHAQAMASGATALAASLPNLQTARKMGLPVINPLDRDYIYPRKAGLTPFDHQRVTAGFMAVNPRCFNLNDIGTGKTLATLWAADYLMSIGAIKRALIVSTLSTLHEAWGKTIFEHLLGRRRSIILHGDRASRERLLGAKADFYIINHDGLGVGTRKQGHKLLLGKLAETIRTRPDIDCIIIDEATAYKNSGTMRYRILRQISAEKRYLWLLSGAPTPNAPTDAWALRKLLEPSLVVNFEDFRSTVMERWGQFRWTARTDAAEKVAAFLQPAIRYNREDCLDLPPVLVKRREVELSPNQKKAMKELKDELMLEMENGAVINAVNEAALRAKLIQIACGAVYSQGGAVHKVDVAPRLAALEEVLDKARGKIIVFSSLTSIVDLLESELKAKGHMVCKVTGATSGNARREIFSSFQCSGTGPRIMVANPAAMAHGVTLTEANTVVWFGPTDNPETYTQANGRVNRPGQVRNMLIVQLVSTTIEKEIFNRLEEKASLQGLILNLVREGNDA